MNIKWNETSCCGQHRAGFATFDDGEVLHINEVEAGARYAARAIKDGAVFASSTRVAGGFSADLTQADLDAIA